MHGDLLFLMHPLIIAVLWRGVHSVSLVPSVPEHVHALVGSCVVIPCSFIPAAPHIPRGRRVDVLLSFRSESSFVSLRSTAFNSQRPDQVSRKFQGRTSLYGKIAEGDCSVKIEGIKKDDPQVFEVALKKSDALRWEKSKSVHLHITETPEPPVISGLFSATEEEMVTLNCSVSYPCPSRPPTLQWKWVQGALLNSTETGTIQTLHRDTQSQVLFASVSFTVSHQVKPRIQCEVQHPGSKRSAIVQDLHVAFPPKDVTVQVETLTVQQGGNALLICSCKADPPVSEYRWSYSQRGHTVHLQHRSHMLRVFNVTKDLRVRCSAENLIGRGESRFTPLNVQYKPAIIRASSICAVEHSKVRCHCTVDSNPKASVTWSVNGTVPPHSYNISMISEPSSLTASLRGPMDKPLSVVCFASNTLGNDSLILLQGEEEEESVFWIWIILPAVVPLVLIFLLVLLVYYCRKRAVKRMRSRRQAVFPEGSQIYQDRMPLYINCTEVTHVYTNGSYQLLYQNCTPVFVRTQQIRPMGRRGGERRRGREVGWMDRPAGGELRSTREVQSSAADADTAIYVEIL